MWHAFKHGCLCCFICKRNLWVPKELMGALGNFSKILSSTRYLAYCSSLTICLSSPLPPTESHPTPLLTAYHFSFIAIKLPLIFGFMQILFRATPTILLYYCLLYSSQDKLIYRTNLTWKGGSKINAPENNQYWVIPITAPGWENWWQQLTWQLYPALTSRSFFKYMPKVLKQILWLFALCS